MLNIVLLCQHGASTGMIAEKIAEAAKKNGVDAIVNAYSVSKMSEVVNTADIILLGPQVRFKLSTFQKEYKNKGVPIVAMDAQDYGRLNGENIFKEVLKNIKQ